MAPRNLAKPRETSRGPAECAPCLGTKFLQLNRQFNRLARLSPPEEGGRPLPEDLPELLARLPGGARAPEATELSAALGTPGDAAMGMAPGTPGIMGISGVGSCSSSCLGASMGGKEASRRPLRLHRLLRLRWSFFWPKTWGEAPIRFVSARSIWCPSQCSYIQS